MVLRLSRQQRRWHHTSRLKQQRGIDVLTKLCDFVIRVPGTDLVTATSHQAEFTLNACEGTLMGFWSPTYAKTLNVPGYHLHLLSADRQRGGHVLGLKARNLKVQAMNANNVVIALPESPAFLEADLSNDPTAALSKAEGAKP